MHIISIIRRAAFVVAASPPIIALVRRRPHLPHLPLAAAMIAAAIPAVPPCRCPSPSRAAPPLPAGLPAPVAARQYHYTHDSHSESRYTQAPHKARHIHVYIGPTAADCGDTAPHASCPRPPPEWQTPSHADMPHADHALTHAAPAFPGAGSCLEGGHDKAAITQPRDATHVTLPGRCLSSAPSASHRLTLTPPMPRPSRRGCRSVGSPLSGGGM